MIKIDNSFKSYPKDSERYTQFKKAMWEFILNGYNRLPDVVKEKIQQFVEIAVVENMTEEELVESLKYMPSDMAMTLCSQFTYEMSHRIMFKMGKKYGEEFIINCDKHANGVPKILTIGEFKHAYMKNKKTRLFTSVEYDYCVINTYNSTDHKYAFDLDLEPDNKYQMMLKNIKQRVKSNRFKYQTLLFIESFCENFIDDALELQKQVLSVRSNLQNFLHY